MKYLAVIMSLVIFSCNQTGDTKALRARIDSLESLPSHNYRPGFGEFMSSIQVHHNKLWFAGLNQNWKLADFEVHEIMESLDAIREYQRERKESGLTTMLNPALDSINAAIQKQDASLFNSSYMLLTNTCNNCHRATKFEFNVVKVPDKPPFSNQDFGVHKMD
jgi:hypothetical protein